MENSRKPVAEQQKKTQKKEVAHHVDYYHNDIKLIFPLARPITTPVLQVHRVGGWKSVKWGPPPNVDGTPSSGSLDSVVAPRDVATPTATVVDFSTSSTAGNSTAASLTTPVSADSAAYHSGRHSSSLVAPSSTLIPQSATISSKQTALSTVANPTSRDSVTPSGQIYKPSSRMAVGLDRRPDVSSSSTSATLIRPRSAHLSAYPTSNTTGPVGAVARINTASTSPDLPTTSFRPVKKTLAVPGSSSTSFTPPASSIYHQKATGRYLRQPRGVGGEFEVVSKAELDDEEFDVLDNGGPSAANGTLKYLSGAFRTDWEDDE